MVEFRERLIKEFEYNQETGIFVRRYTAQIHVSDKQVHLGCFSSLEEASAAYQAAKLVHHQGSTV